MGWTRTGSDVEYWECGHKTCTTGDAYPRMHCTTCAAMTPEARDALIASRKQKFDSAVIKPKQGAF